MTDNKLFTFQKQILKYKYIGLDSMCFLYQFSAHPIYSPFTKILFKLIGGKQIHTVTSAITIVETFVQAEKTHSSDLIYEYEKVFQTLPNFEIIPIDWQFARLSSKLRAKYSFLKTPDALQLSAALLKGCKGFITNDEKLQKVKEIHIILLKQFIV